MVTIETRRDSSQTTRRLQLAQRLPAAKHLERLARIAQETSSAIVVTDAEGVTQWVNPAFTRISGYTLEEMIGRVPGKLLQGPDTDRETASRIGAAMRANQSVSFEILNYHKSGAPYWIGMRLEPMTNTQGEVDGYIAMQADITEKRAQRLAMESLTARFNLATRVAGVGIFERDLDWRNSWWNDVIYDILGRSPVDFKPSWENFLLTVHPDDRLKFKPGVDGFTLANNSTVAYRIVRPDGAIRHVESISAIIRLPGGGNSHIVGAILDVTGRVEAHEKLLEEIRLRQLAEVELGLAQKLESVGRLAAGIAHEINTPIQYVSDSVHFLGIAFEELIATVNARQGDLSRKPRLDLNYIRDEVPQAIARTLDGAQRVSRIVGAMKEFAHPDGAAQSPADLNRTLETTLLIAQNEYKYVAQVDLQRGLIPEVVCNAGELSQVFLNLIVNSAHALEEAGRDTGTGRITISTLQRGDNVEIRFEDNGSGIPPGILDKIYDPFFTTKEVGKGTGQGLAIARSIITDKHGGKIGVKSSRGIGTCFTISLPIAGKDAGAP